MDNQILDTISYAPEGHQNRVSSASRKHLLKAAKWSRFVGITFLVFFCFAIIGIIIAFISGGDTFLSQMQALNPSSLLYKGGIISLLFIACMLAFFLAVILSMLSFSRNIKTALNSNDQVTFENGMVALNKYWLLNLILAALGILSSLGNLITVSEILF